MPGWVDVIDLVVMKQFAATLRFYEELNDFLPSALRKVAFPYRFQANPAIKDVIEAHHVPHTEVDLIIANGESVDFSYQLKNGDVVSVYPTFEGFDVRSIVKLRPEPLRKTAFILDVHLGKLSARLRMLGMDTAYGPPFEDHQIIHRALSEHRIILTSDRGLLQHKVVTHGYCVRSGDADEQVLEVIHRFDLRDSLKPFSRCIRCNGMLHGVAKADVMARLEPLTQKYYTEFSRCDSCGNVYWEGSHFEKLIERVKEIEGK